MFSNRRRQLVLGVTASTTLVTEEGFVSNMGLRPDLRYTVVPGADYYVPEEQPEAVVAITRMMKPMEW